MNKPENPLEKRSRKKEHGEPLKSKELYVHDYELVDKESVHPAVLACVFEKKDVISAVEYLREKIIPILLNKHNYLMKSKEVQSLIDEAFPIKKEKKNKC